ncbi:UDP-N-acetylmuramyl tripeptide synthase [Lachnospiraceae bacterium]|nr:UDP-N-acetylmuramyl tripeptide synthase [Lachnospiraceae bacterium]
MRFFLALYISKTVSKILRLVAKNRGTILPGKIALKIDPKFLSHIKGVNSEKVVFVTGTNGKSTTTNIINHILTHSGLKVSSNLKGANMVTGVTTALLKDISMRGRLKTDAIVMETDERYIHLIREQLPAKYICITNVQKDQAQRNGEPSYILDKLKKAIDSDVTLFVNKNEPNSYSLGSLAGRAISYGVAPNSQSYRKDDDFFSVSQPCPCCHNPLVFHSYNIENIGPFYCPVCGFGSGENVNYYVSDVDYEGKVFTVNARKYAFNFNTAYFLYCYVLAIGVAAELGVPGKRIAAALKDFKNIRGRLETKKIAGKTLNYIKMKQENSETTQSSLNLIARDDHKKIFMIGYDEYLDFFPPLVISFYPFDYDPRSVLRSGVDKWICMSKAMGRAVALRFLYDGFDEKDMIVLPDSKEETIEKTLSEIPGKDVVYLVEEIPYWKK